MSEIPESESTGSSADDWLAGATIEFGGEIGESTEIGLEGIEIDDSTPVA